MNGGISMGRAIHVNHALVGSIDIQSADAEKAAIKVTLFSC